LATTVLIMEWFNIHFKVKVKLIVKCFYDLFTIFIKNKTYVFEKVMKFLYFSFSMFCFQIL